MFLGCCGSGTQPDTHRTASSRHSETTMPTSMGGLHDGELQRHPRGLPVSSDSRRSPVREMLNLKSDFSDLCPGRPWRSRAWDGGPPAGGCCHRVYSQTGPALAPGLPPFPGGFAARALSDQGFF